jgi:hypothetical protein
MQASREWRIRYNQELNRLYRSLDIIVTIKVARLRWGGYLQRKGNNEIPKDSRLSVSKEEEEWRDINFLWLNGVVEDLQENGDPKVVNGRQ